MALNFNSAFHIVLSTEVHNTRRNSRVRVAKFNQGVEGLSELRAHLDQARDTTSSSTRAHAQT